MLNLNSNKGDIMENLEMLLNENLLLDESNKLQELYKKIFIDNCCDCETLEDAVTMYNNNEFSCINGCIGALIYYSQTEGIFKNHFNEVLEMVQEYFETYGYNNIGLDANNLVWLTFEFMVTGWYYDIKDYIYNID